LHPTTFEKLTQSAMQKLNVAIFIFDDVEVLDFAGPYEVFSRTRLEPGVASRRSNDTAPFTVFTVAKTAGPIATTGGMRVIPDFNFATAPRIDLLIVPPGFGTRRLLEYAPVLRWLQTVASQAKQVASVCTGALLLAKIGLLSGRRATTHWASHDLLASLDTTIVVDRQARFVIDGIVTSAGVAAGIDMAFAVVEAICGPSVAEETAHYIEYRRGERT
jgi:transcriptional regulator GlxA family with amidase domain